MAEAAKKTRTVIDSITLTLSLEEAEAVAAVLGNVGGDVTNTPRKHSDAVFWALSKAGVDVARATGDHAGRKVSGDIRFHRSATEAHRAKSGLTSPSDFLKGLGY